ncbi:hypothetical protein Tco_0084586 [Tanacetum coccineum]
MNSTRSDQRFAKAVSVCRLLKGKRSGMIAGVSRVRDEGREDVREVFQQRGSGAKRKLSRCGRNQMGNEPILALPEGADDFVVYYDARSKDLEACLEKGEGDCLLTNRWLSMKKDIASCGSKYLAYSEVEVEYQGSSGLLLQPELWVVEGLTLERCSTFGKKDKLEPSYVGTFEIFGYIGPTFLFDELRVLMPRVVKSRDEIFSRWGYCDNHDLSRLDNQSIERDRLIGIGFVLNFVKFISFTFGDKEMISVIEAVSFVRILRLREVARVTARIALEFAPEFVYVYRLDFVECWVAKCKVSPLSIVADTSITCCIVVAILKLVVSSVVREDIQRSRPLELQGEGWFWYLVVGSYVCLVGRKEGSLDVPNSIYLEKSEIENSYVMSPMKGARG